MTTINIHDELDQLCTRLGLVSSYVARLDIRPGDVTATLLTGQDGRFKGSPYVDQETGEPVTETLHFDVTS